MAAENPACRACGRTEHFACISDRGEACAWAGPGLCTACIAIGGRIFTPAELAFLAHAAGGRPMNMTRPSGAELTAQGVLTLRARLQAMLDAAATSRTPGPDLGPD